ncbi:MAG: DNA repair protein RecN [Pseudomonadota bacterium]
MLVALTVQDVVIVDRLDLVFAGQLGVLTGETGAGKSILLDALGLACGGRADRGLVRTGADQARVTAVFRVAPDHEARAVAAAAGLELDGDELVLRRVLQVDGRSRAFVNDQPVTSTLLRALGAMLLEVHGQNEQLSLFDRAAQRDLLDAYGGHGALRAACRETHDERRAAEAARDLLVETVERARRDEEYLRHRLAELDDLAPELGEEERLAELRTVLLARGRLTTALADAGAMVAGSDGALDRVARAERGLERQAEAAGELFQQPLAALERARIELDEAAGRLDDVAAQLRDAGEDTGRVEDRLFALRDAARKHRVSADGLVALRGETATALAELADATGSLAATETRLAAAVEAHGEATAALGDARRRAAERLAEAVMVELPPLKLERVRFVVELETLPPENTGPDGGDQVEFLVATTPGRAPGPLAKIASGGELARIMLALKVVLARLGAAATLVFDEIDSGIGGATADAVGERLARLGRERQVLVVTHAPQVAARAAHHLKVEKSVDDDVTTLTVRALEGAARREEIARMLAGATVTEAARAAAASLLAAEAGG